MWSNSEIGGAMMIRLDEELPEPEEFSAAIRRAPDRGFRLSHRQTETALKNGLRYIPEQHHALLIPEFLEELRTRGRIYGYRYRPSGPIKAKPIAQYRETAWLAGPCS
jgi:urocanate hydratase